MDVRWVDGDAEALISDFLPGPPRLSVTAKPSMVRDDGFVIVGIDLHDEVLAKIREALA